MWGSVPKDIPGYPVSLWAWGQANMGLRLFVYRVALAKLFNPLSFNFPFYKIANLAGVV